MDASFYTKILDNLSSAVFLIDNSLSVKYYNSAFNEIFSPKVENLRVGNALNCSLLMGDQKCGEGAFCDKCILNKLLRRALVRGRTVKREVLEKSIFVSNVEKFFRIRLSVKPLNGEIFYQGKYVCVIDDITEIPQLSDRLSHENLRIDLMRAKKIQALFLPEKKSAEPIAEFDFIYEQSYEVGGDFFDVFKTSETGAGGYVADVSGAGLSGGMLTVFLHENYPKDTTDPSQALNILSRRFNSYNFPEESYITVFSFYADYNLKTIYLCNAGHSVPAILITENNAKIVDLSGKTISCWYDNALYQNVAFKYSAGDKLILMTDGIYDMQDAKGNEYGINRLLDIAQKYNKSDAATILNLIKSDISAFTGSYRAKNSDDKTVVVLELK